MKTVMDKQNVAHAWMNQIQNNARTPGTGNLFFNDKTIYSYGRHFEIAKHVTNEHGQNAVLFTLRGYSNSTSKHISVVRSASWGNIIYVPDPANTSIDNFNAWLREAESIASKLPTSRKPEIYLNQLGGVLHQVERYVEFFGYVIPDLLKAALSIGDKAEYSAYADRKAVHLAEEKRLQNEAFKKRVAKEKKEFAKKIQQWRNFEIPRLYMNIGTDILRFNETNNRVETSQSVEIPAAIAKDFYNLVLQKISAGGCNNCDAVLMDKYQVLEINADFIRVGCHKIEIKEIKALTTKLGW